ncbi:swi5-like zinc finger protein [Chamberlinius hualienensis]
MDFSPVVRNSRKTSSGRLHGQFKSPVLVNDDKCERRNSDRIECNSSSPMTKKQQLEQLMMKLNDSKENCQKMEKEIQNLTEEGMKESQLELHISKLHEYNEIKDATQMVLGQLAMLEGLTVAQLHQRFHLDLKE